MRMGDRDGVNSAQRLDQGDGVRVDQADAIPQNVSLFRPYKQRPLANPKGRHGRDTPNPLAFLMQYVPNKLPFVLTDGTVLRRVVSSRKLCSTGHT